MKFPVTDVRWEITSRCNYRCIHCYNDSGGNISGKELELDEIKQILDDFEVLGILDVCFQGGEPFLREDIFEILSYSYSTFKVGIITNGSLLSRKKIDRLEGNVDYINVSIDASSPATYREFHGIEDMSFWKKVLDSVRLLAKKGIPVSISMVITKRNYHEVHDFLNLGETIGADEVFFMMFKPMGRGKLYWRELFIPPEEYTNLISDVLKHKKDFNLKIQFEKYSYAWLHNAELYARVKEICESMKGKMEITPECANAIAVLPNADVVPCLVLRELICGNLRQDSIADIYCNSPVYKYLRNLKIPELCMRCDHIVYCRSGCLGNKIAHHCTLLDHDPVCPYRAGGHKQPTTAQEVEK